MANEIKVRFHYIALAGFELLDPQSPFLGIVLFYKIDFVFIDPPSSFERLSVICDTEGTRIIKQQKWNKIPFMP